MIEESFSPLPAYLLRNRGHVLRLDDIALRFRISSAQLQDWIEQLNRCGAGLAVEEGQLVAPGSLDLLLPDQVRSLCRAENLLARNIHYFMSVRSTNDLALRCAEEAAEGTLFVTEDQSAGRGRAGRQWTSQPGKGLHMTWIAKPPRGACLTLLPLAVGVGVVEGLIRLFSGSISVSLKWPNDILLGDKKMGGILCESVQAGDTIKGIAVGIGINVYPMQWPAEVARKAAALADAVKDMPPRAGILAAILDGLEDWYGIYKQGRYDDILGRWSEAAPMSLGQRVRWGTLEGITRGVTSQGALRLETPDGGSREVLAGDVELV